MSFLSDLGNQINEQYGYGENSTNSLDVVEDNGRVVNFGTLGEFKDKIDQSAERSYTVDGLIRNTRPNLRRTFFQQPDITVVFKKRMFASLAENNRLDLLEEKERLFIRASKKLIQNKCRAMSHYERLCKIEAVAKETGQFNSYLAPTMFSALEELARAGFQIVSPDTRRNLDKVQRAIKFSDVNDVSNYTVDYESAYVGTLGEGFGTFEITTIPQINTSVSTEFGGGNASLTIEDPYNILIITLADIDAAIADATNGFRNGPFGRGVEIELKELINNGKRELNIRRGARGASPIRFVVNPQTLISKKLRVINEGIGKEVIFNYNSGFAGIGSDVDLDSNAVGDGNDQKLSDEEAQLTGRIISNIYSLIGLQETTESQNREQTDEINYARNRMRLFFNGRSIIQSMDTVTVFMTTKTMEDEKITQGFRNVFSQGGLAIGEKFDDLVRNMNALVADFSGDNVSPDELDKNMIVGPEFPMWLWRMFRNDFTRQSAGTSVFVGLVRNASSNYNDGKHVLTINCHDNSAYFSKSQINLQPSMDVFNSNLYDPLTPFDVSFDAATGMPLNEVTEGSYPPLLQENRRLMESRRLKFKNGRFAGQPVSQIVYQTDDEEYVYNSFRKVLYDPDGLVYRWKQGIQSLTKTARPIQQSSITDERSPLLTKNPFAGQDVMSVLSLLITGEPYNFNNFLKAAVSNGNSTGGLDALTNTKAAVSYIAGLTNDLIKRNGVWGNFIPFKSLVVNEDAASFILTGQADLLTKNTQLQVLLKKRAQLEDAIALTNANYDQPYGRDEDGQLEPADPQNPNQERRSSFINREQELLNINNQIEQLSGEFERSVANNLVAKKQGSITIIGDDASLNPTLSEGENYSSEDQRLFSKREFRRKLDSYTLRRLWHVRGNTDPNLMIVDDQYDKSFDIMGFERAIGGRLSLFDSEYSTIDGQIRNTAKILGLEVFADTQGHIRVRPPQYNRMPSSVFYQMFRDRFKKGVKVFPDFLESLYFNQFRGVLSRIEIVEDEIRLRAIALGYVEDRDIENFLKGGGNIDTGSLTGGRFRFVTDAGVGLVHSGNKDFRSFLQQARPDSNEDLQSLPLKDIQSEFETSASATRLFDVAARSSRVVKDSFKNALSDKVVTNYEIVRKRLRRKKGVESPSRIQLLSNNKFLFRATDEDMQPFRDHLGISSVDALAITNEIATFISERQKLLISAANAIKNFMEGRSLNVEAGGQVSLIGGGGSFKNLTQGSASRAIQFPWLSRGEAGEVPQILEHMIEYENVHNYGHDSGKRYIIRDAQIVSLSISETEPAFTMVNVNGKLGQGLVDTPGSLVTTNGGNAVTSAYAVDYDMWRMYGFRTPQSVEAPFFSDPDSQCAPYAVFLLNLARKNILQGSVTVNAYNEFYQPGDVVYIESRDLLFYVDRVSHSLNYGSLSTTLSLKYGHNPGEYIPTMLDIVGKILYNSQGFTGQFRSSRYDASDGDVSLGAVILDPIGNNANLENLLSDTGTDQANNALIGNVTRGEYNRQLLSKMLLAASGALNPVRSRRQKSVIELRVYGDSYDTTAIASTIVAWMKNPQAFSNFNEKILGDTEMQENFKIPDDSIRIRVMEEADVESPSRAAWNAVRFLEDQHYFSSTRTEWETIEGLGDSNYFYTASVQDRILEKAIIDVWVVIEAVEDTTQNETGTSQFAQEANKTIADAEISSYDPEYNPDLGY